MHPYAIANRAGKFLAYRIKVQRAKTRIFCPIHPISKHKIINPLDIADAFADYYSSLYNLKKDNLTPHPLVTEINDFLSSINRSSLTHDQLFKLNAPFTPEEIGKVNNSLPSGKALGPDGFSNNFEPLTIYWLLTFLNYLTTWHPQPLSPRRR